MVEANPAPALAHAVSGPRGWRGATDTTAARDLPTPSAPSGVQVLLRLEGAVLLGMALAAYAQFGAGWGSFALWLFVPDLSLLGYLAGPRVGRVLYNAAHWAVGPVLLLALGVFAALPWAVAGGLIWLAHIGLDRALGYGLKQGADFASTHLGRIGRRARADVW